MTNAAYQHLVSHAADVSPHTWDDLPELSASDIQTICASKLKDVVENLVEGDFLDLLVQDQAEGKNGAVRVPVAMEEACRKVLFLDVEEECDQRDEERIQSLATHRHCRMAGYRTALDEEMLSTPEAM